MKSLFQMIPVLTLAAALAAVAEPVPQNIREAIQQVRTSDGVQPRQPFYLLEQAVPKAAGDVEQRLQLAKMLAEAVVASDTTSPARTVLCQHLAKVAGEAELPALRNLLAAPATAADARIAVGAVVGAPAPAGSEPDYLAAAADVKAAARVSGLASLARFYPATALPACVKALRDSDPVVSATAIQLVGRLDGAALARELPALDAARQALALDVLAERRVVASRDAVTRLTASSDEPVRQAAIRALGAVGDAGSVAVLAELSADDALAQVNAPGVDEAILKGIAAGKAEARVALMNAAAARGLSGLTPVLLSAANATEEKVQAAALKMLGRSGDVSAYPQLVSMLGGTRSDEVEGAVRLMGRRMTDRQMRLAPLLARLQGSPVSAQIAVLRTLAPLGGEDALAPVRERLAAPDATVRDAAVRALAEWTDAAAVADLKKIMDDPAASTVHKTLAARAADRLASSWMRYAALAYLDCGPAMEATGKDGVRMRVVNGKPWAWTEQPEGTAAYAGDKLTVEVTGLKAGRAHLLGFTWWDHDGNGRAQSVWVGGQPAVAKTALPSWKGKQEAAAMLTASIPAAAIKDGRVSVEFRREAASNVVLSEVWLSDVAAGEEKRLTAPLQTVVPLKPPVVKANAGAPKKVLVVTGLEYPGHKWQETAPIVAAAIGEDKRLEVSVTEDPRTLASTELNKYDVIVLNYQNHEVPAPEGALANLKRAVEGGKGLVLVHFACGAFIDWPTKTVTADFGVIAGRVWNPKLRGHDPRGPFKVRITDAGHPITKGLADFDTEDELYTCLDGAAPIHVLATAKSKVDQKDYPMAFVLTPGKGRTFHCVLGHDAKALKESVGALYRRGTAWAAGLEN